MFVGTIKGLINEEPYELEIAETGQESTLYIKGEPAQFDEAHAHFSYDQNNWLWVNGDRCSITEAFLSCSDITFVLEHMGFNQELLFKDEQFLNIESFDLFADMKGQTYITLKLLLSANPARIRHESGRERP